MRTSAVAWLGISALTVVTLSAQSGRGAPTALTADSTSAVVTASAESA